MADELEPPVGLAGAPEPDLEPDAAAPEPEPELPDEPDPEEPVGVAEDPEAAAELVAARKRSVEAKVLQLEEEGMRGV